MTTEKKATALVIAERPQDFVGIARHLTEEGYEVRVKCGQGLLPDRARCDRFDVVVLCGCTAGAAWAETLTHVPSLNHKPVVIRLNPDDAEELENLRDSAVWRMAFAQRLREVRRLWAEDVTEVGEAIALSEALSTIVHAINNPLASVLGYAQLAVTSTSRERLDAYLQTICQQAVRCQTMVQKLSSFVQPHRLEKEIIDLNAASREAVSLFEDGLTSRGIKIHLELCPDTLPVRADARHIRYVLASLVRNAREALEGAPGGSISVTSLCSGQEALVTVSDTGPGIPAELRESVFQPFFTRKPARAGLGLHISRLVLRACHGDIEIVEKEGPGAAFRVRLPLVLENDSPEKTEWLLNESQDTAPCDNKILVVQDDKPVATLVSQILPRIGQKVDLALTPAQSLERITERDYDIILMDAETSRKNKPKALPRRRENDARTSGKGVLGGRERFEAGLSNLLSALDAEPVQRPLTVARICSESPPPR
ncbi:MAG: ATP-binding protein [bacterium]|nr:ATP-binding protein [bacterium]